ncbi:retropepsin-like aspartic protease [Aureibaculum sp. 2210JD6-5]|uniref:retropepsin-like aspartic protease n=1 Tax=Aureibaculum sp. 2210JD6-5 TaxID=3103957 RepID=UPI002AACF6E3|nr:retropepsin-like aspartic protease [Aureibaculum sp. 2210JD6-5]MDY7396994.1 retropepsin-like aspartic protease [Aureibaculum sp. 2210JD6-5]
MKKLFKILIFFTLSNTAFAQEIIPFELKDDNRIYIKASINKSDTLSMVFDLGANITVLNTTRLKHHNLEIAFDSIVSNQGTNGKSNEKLSSNNSIKLGNGTYRNINILGISYPENDILDGIIGWNFFETKKVRINYEKKELVVYDILPELSKNFTKSKLKFINNLPYIGTIVYNGRKKSKILAMLDIGYNGELLIYAEEVKNNDLLNKFQVIGEATSSGTDGSVSKSDVVLLPKFDIAGFEIYNMPAYLTKTEFKSVIPALMGGNLLKRFHIVLDFKEKVVYIKPNTLINSKF